MDLAIFILIKWQTGCEKQPLIFIIFMMDVMLIQRLFLLLNENFGQPRLMNQDEASKFLEIIYQHSFYYSKEQ